MLIHRNTRAILAFYVTESSDHLSSLVLPSCLPQVRNKTVVAAVIWRGEDASLQDESCVRTTGVCQHQSCMNFNKVTPPALSFRVKSSSRSVSGSQSAALPMPAKAWGFFFFLNLYPTTVHDEVIVYLPTGGFLGDSSLSAKPWRKPQFLPAEWKVEAKVWIHVGNGVSGPVCVCVSQVTKLEFCFFCFSHTHINTYFKHFSRICCFTLLFYVSIVSSFAQVILLAETRGDFALLEAWSMSYIWRHFRVPTVKHELDLVVFVCPLWWHASVMTHLSLKLAT